MKTTPAWPKIIDPPSHPRPLVSGSKLVIFGVKLRGFDMVQGCFDAVLIGSDAVCEHFVFRKTR
jgi:hypothetical protein